MNAEQILTLLPQRHAEDVFVPECKSGPTWGGSHLRLDAWAMKRSWASPCVWGYEIKVSRQDFLRDDKWTEYLAYCNQFYFACPKGLIQPGELPPEAGLLWVTEGGKPFTKKKAPHRQTTIPEDLWRYLLMSRTRVVSKAEPETREERAGRWAEWLKSESVSKDIGLLAKGAIREWGVRIQQENAELRRKIEGLVHMEERAKELGFDTRQPVGQWQAKDRLSEFSREIPPRLKSDLYRAKSAIDEIMILLDNAQQ